MGVTLKYSSPAHRLLIFGAASLVACKGSSAHPKADAATMSPSDSIVAWARGVDSLADSAHAREFGVPARSTEGGTGRFYELADSAVLVDVEDLGETGRARRRFYARAARLRLAVRIDERYDQPMSGNVVKTKVDSTWFTADTAIQWRDSAGVVRVGRDSLLEAHGREVLAQYLSSIRLAASAGPSRR